MLVSVINENKNVNAFTCLDKRQSRFIGGLHWGFVCGQRSLLLPGEKSDKSLWLMT